MLLKLYCMTKNPILITSKYKVRTIVINKKNKVDGRPDYILSNSTENFMVTSKTSNGDFTK